MYKVLCGFVGGSRSGEEVMVAGAYEGMEREGKNGEVYVLDDRGNFRLKKEDNAVANVE